MADANLPEQTERVVQESRDYTLKGQKEDKSITHERPIMTTPPPPPPDKPSEGEGAK